MARPKLTKPNYSLRRDSRGVWVVSWTDPNTGTTRKRSCRTKDYKAALAVRDLVLEKPLHPIDAAIAKLQKRTKS